MSWEMCGDVCVSVVRCGVLVECVVVMVVFEVSCDGDVWCSCFFFVSHVVLGCAASDVRRNL